MNSSKVHLLNLSKPPAVRRDRFCSRAQSKMDQVSAKLELLGTTNMDDILCDPTVDVVTIALPHTLHSQMAVLTMGHGKNVICEVPVWSHAGGGGAARGGRRTNRQAVLRRPVQPFRTRPPFPVGEDRIRIRRVWTTAVPPGGQPLCPCLGPGTPESGRSAAGELFL